MVTSRKAFTLLELMVVVAIMAALSTLSVNGYRALTKGMRDRSAIVAVQTLVDAARQRAEIDRKPMIVYFYDELLQEANESVGDDLVGHGVAVAVRPMGRFSAIDGNYLCDEFGDLDQIYSEENPDSDGGSQQNNKTAMRLYRLADGNYADVKPSVVSKSLSASYLLTGESVGDSDAAEGGAGGEKLIRCFAFEKVGGNAGFAVGDVYGGEFASVTLPKGYYFGSSVPSSVGRVRVGEPMKINPTSSGASGAESVTVYSMRASSTQLDPVGKTTTGGN